MMTDGSWDSRQVQVKKQKPNSTVSDWGQSEFENGGDDKPLSETGVEGQPFALIRFSHITELV